MNEIGHNQPPSLIELAEDTARDISAWMAEHPVVQTEDEARDAKLFLDRGKLAIKDIEDERDGRVRPLNEQVKSINAIYAPKRNLLSTIIGSLQSKLSTYLAAEERKRIAAAQEAAHAAEQARLKAQAAERAERNALMVSDTGELGVDLAATVAAADQAFSEFEKASRQAAIAERETKVKIVGGFTRAISLKEKETLVVIDHIKAIAELGLTEDLREAVLKGARAYRKLHNKLPQGVESITERGI